ncbi:MAG: hypothetical protein R3A47_11700 [Polyangiales bacterium]
MEVKVVGTDRRLIKEVSKALPFDEERNAVREYRKEASKQGLRYVWRFVEGQVGRYGELQGGCFGDLERV